MKKQTILIIIIIVLAITAVIEVIFIVSQSGDTSLTISTETETVETEKDAPEKEPLNTAPYEPEPDFIYTAPPGYEVDYNTIQTENYPELTQTFIQTETADEVTETDTNTKEEESNRESHAITAFYKAESGATREELDEAERIMLSRLETLGFTGSECYIDYTTGEMTVTFYYPNDFEHASYVFEDIAKPEMDGSDEILNITIEKDTFMFNPLIY
jgi:hypothetical protein